MKKTEKSPEVICIGQALVDCIIRGRTPFKETVDFAEEITLSTGGDALNEACVLETLGCHAKLICGLGYDLAGELVLQKAQKHGVDISEIYQSDTLKTPIANLTVDKEGGRISCNSPATMLAGYLPNPTIEKSVKVVSLASLFRAPLDQKDTIIQLIKTAKQAGAIVCADTKIPTFRKLTLSDLKEVLPLIDYIFPNEKEAEYLTGKKDHQEMAKALHQMGLKNVILKTGKHGITVHTQTAQFQLPAPEVPVIDSTGAGDNFVAGFISALLTDAPLTTCCHQGLLQAASSLQHMGAT